MSFRISALPMSSFQPLFALDEVGLSARNIRRVVADERPVYPCRVSLQDATGGEELLLLPHVHHPVDTPYRAAGPIYVRRAALQAMPGCGEVPELLRHRVLSLRAYDAGGMMQDANVVPGDGIEDLLSALFGRRRTAYVHVHFASPGCYACRVDRA
jgi:hypothetical protein